MPARFGSIRVRLLVLLLFLGLAPLLLAGGLAEVFGTRYLASAVGAELERVARVLAVSLDRRVEATRQVVESWAAFPDVRRAVRDGRPPGAPVSGQPASALLADVRGVIVDLAEILLVDRDGRLVGASGTPEADSFGEERWFYQTVGAGCGAVTFDELSWSARAADHVTAINVSVCDGQRVTGVLRAILSLGGVLGLAADLEIGDEVEIRIIRSDGETLAAVHGQGAHPEGGEGTVAVRELARDLVGSATGHREATLGGPPAMIGYAASVGSGRFTGLGWVVLVAEPLSIAHRPVSFFQRGLLALAGLVLLAVVIAGARAARALTGPLERSAAVARAIAGGSLSQRLQPSGQEELDSLAESLNHMTTNLGEMVGSVRLAAHEVEGVSRQIAGGSERVVSGSRDQIERVGQTNALLRDADDAVQQVGVSLADMASCTDDAAASILEMEASIAEIGGSTEALSNTTASALGAVEQMVDSIREVDAALDQLRALAGGTATAVRESDAALRQVEGLATRTAQASEQVLADAELGRESVRHTVDGMGEIESAALRTAAAISALTEEVGKIGGITGIIDDVTEQTNLLALNAAILSAQAGEHGRGFSVVAQEIKALAERTARSTQEIATLVRSIQEGAAGAARAVEAGVAHVRDGVALSRQAGGALDQILAGARASSDMVRGIASAAGEHAERSHQITVAIQRLHETVGRIATTTQQQTQGCTALVQDGQRIRDMTERVRRAIHEQAQGSRRISTSMQRMTAMARGIEGAAQRQRGLSRSLVEAMASIESLSRDNVATIAEVDAAIGALTERAAGLRSRIARFRDTA